MSTLYIVGTPVGNLEDITLRALRILKEVDLIAAEDTRHTKILLDRYNIIKPLTSYHKFNIKQKTKHLITEIINGKNVALVSDAGMPGIADPGYEFVQEAIKNDIKVEPIPNTSAFLIALSASGIKTDRFVFEGFLPLKKKDRDQRLGQLKNEVRTVVLYEAPHRLVRTLADLKCSLGDKNICIARELTKKFEEFSRGRISEMIRSFTDKKPKGEFVIVLEGAGLRPKENIEDVKMLLAELIGTGMSRKDAVKIIAKEKKMPKNELYKLALGV